MTFFHTSPKQITSLLVLVFVTAGCFKTDTENTWQLAVGNNKIWNIDEVTVQQMDNYDYEVVAEHTYEDLGTLQFTGQSDDCMYHLDAEIPLLTYNLGPIEGVCEFSDTKFYFRDPISPEYPLFGADIVKLTKNELILFCSIAYSVVYDNSYFFQFHFKCSKK